MSKLHRIRLSPEEITPEAVSFGGKSAHYLLKVLRLKTGDCIEGFDGERAFLIRLLPVERGKVLGEILRTSNHVVTDEPEIRLAFCCVRPGPMEEILRHGTELGVSKFIPILSSRTGRRPEEKKARWDSIVTSATAQSGRIRLPIVEEPVKLQAYVHRATDAQCKILLSLTPSSKPLPELLQKDVSRVEILAGPEGGFETWEESLAVEAGYDPARLAGSVLRTETACIAATGVIAAWYHWQNSDDAPGAPPGD